MSAESPLYSLRLEELKVPLETPQKPSGLGLAIANRGLKENLLLRARMGEMLETPPLPMPQLLADRMILISAENIDRKLHDPSSKLTMATQLDDFFAVLTAEEYFNLVMSDKDPEEVSELREVVNPDGLFTFAKTAATETMKVIPQDVLNEDASGSVDDAKMLAQEREVPVEDVYTRDDLYEELIRRNYTPEETARRMIAFIRGLTLSKITTIFARILTAKEALAYPGGEEDIEEFTREMAADPEFKTQMRKDRKGIIKASKTMAREYIDRIWGKSALDTLPPEVVKALS